MFWGIYKITHNHVNGLNILREAGKRKIINLLNYTLVTRLSEINDRFMKVMIFRRG